jgi:hypothetical protein
MAGRSMNLAEDTNGSVAIEASLHNPAMTRPDGYDSAPVPKRVGIRQLLPDSWIGQTLELSYVAADGGQGSARGVYLDRCGSGPILRARTGEMVCYAWERICTYEVVEG